MSDEIDVSAFMDFALDQSTAPEDIQAVEDANTVGLRFGFIGAGQAGCNLTSVLWENFGYRRAILFNTTESDLGYTAIPQSNHIVPDGFDGAGKQRSRGSEAAVAAKADIFSALHARMKSVDYIFIVTSGGGGTGSGSTPVLAEIATQYVKQTLDCSVEEAQKRVGFIIMLPAASDGAAVRSNAGALLSDLTHEGKSKYGPMLLVDNERIKRMGQGSLSDWQLKSNTVTARLFDIFNALAARNSRISTFDPTDYKSVLSSGIITVGFTMIPKIEQQTTISASIRGNLKNNLLAD
jgi:cell division GTPase FtsZ